MRKKFSFENAVIPLVIVILVGLLALAYYNRRAQDQLISALLVEDPAKTDLTVKQADMLLNLSISKLIGLLDHVFQHAVKNRVPSNQAIILASYYRVPSLYVSIQNLKHHEMRENSYVNRCKDICAYDFAEMMYEGKEENACKKSAEMVGLLNLEDNAESIGKVVEPLNERFLVFLLQETDSLKDFLRLNDIDDNQAEERAVLYIIHQLGVIAREETTHQFLMKQLLLYYDEGNKHKVHFLENAMICLKQRGALLVNKTK